MIDEVGTLDEQYYTFQCEAAPLPEILPEMLQQRNDKAVT